MENKLEHIKNQRVVTFLDRNEVDFLDKLGKDALFSTGFKLSRTKLIAWMVDFTKSLKISGTGIRSESDLEKKVIESLEKMINSRTIPPATESNLEGGAL